jgi:PAS domain S-box-containing protein
MASFVKGDFEAMTTSVQDRVLILFSDATAGIASALTQAGIPCSEVAPDRLRSEVEAGAAALVVNAHQLDEVCVAELRETLNNQPLWSDLPLILIGDMAALLPFFAHMIHLDHAPSTAVLLNAIQSAYENRRRQYRVRDLLARQQREMDEQQQAHEEVLHMVDRIGDTFFAVDPEWRFRYVNPHAAEIVGQTPEQLLNKTLWEAYPQLVGSPLEEHYYQAMAEQIPRRIEERGVLSGHWYEITVYPSDRGLSVYGRDITARKEAEQAAEHAHEELFTTLERISDLFYALDQEWRYVYVNQHLLDQLGKSREELIGRSLWEVFPQLQGTVYEANYRKVADEQTAVHFEAKGVLLDGWYEVSVYPSPDGLSFFVRDVTRRKKMELALREREEQTRRQLAELQSIYATAPAGLCYFDTDLRYVSINENLAQWDGRSVEEHLGRTVREYSPKLADYIEPFLQKVLETGEPLYDHEFQASPSGDPDHVHDWLLNYHPVKDETGNIIGINAVVQDVTQWRQLLRDYEASLAQQKQTEQALRESEERYRQLIELSPDAVIVHDSGTILYTNPATLNLLGRSEDEVLDRLLFDFIHPDYHELVRGRIKTINATGGPLPRVEQKWLHKDGSLVDIELAAVQVFWHGKKAIQVIVRDISERKRTEQILKQRRESFEALAENVPDIIARFDRQHRHLYVNRAVEKATGIPRERFIGKTNRDLNLPEQQVLFWEETFNEIFQSGEAKTVEFTYFTPSGPTVFQAHIVPELALDGSVGTILSIVRNITELKQTEEMLRLAHNELERRVQERTRELRAANQQLRQEITERERAEQELAEVRRRLNEAQEAERKYLAHELHDGPMQELSAISFTLSLLKAQIDNQEQTQNIKAVEEKVSQVNQTLRMMANNLRPPILSNFGLLAAMRDYAHRFQQENTDLALDLSLPDQDGEWPEGTAFTIYRIYQQALHNIVQHAQATAVWVKLEETSEQTRLEIHDDGCGFQVPEHWVIFARQNHLGIVGMMERAEAIGGAMDVQSAPGQGTRLFVRVPKLAGNFHQNEDRVTLSS